MRTILTTSAAALLLTACTGDTETAEAETVKVVEAETTVDVDMGGADTDGMDRDAVTMDGEGMGMGEGRVVEVDRTGGRVRIEHDAIPAVGMDAMTMFFEAQRGVDLAGLDAGDEIRFLLDRGRDGTYRLAAVCDLAATDHEPCMSEMREAM